MTQDVAWYVTLILIGLLSVIFITAIGSTASTTNAAELAKRAYAPRGKIFWGLLLAGVIITVATLTPWPHSASATHTPARVVDVMAAQWRWEMNEQQFSVGEPLEFRVQSKDVNHGFAIYDQDMTILAQIQAMPGYTNVLRHTFNTPGQYKILCMEFCGVAHHSMITTLTVLPANN